MCTTSSREKGEMTKFDVVQYTLPTSSTSTKVDLN